MILQRAVPYDVSVPRPLPAVAPLDPGAWLHVDDAYAAQMALREDLLATRRDAVLAHVPEAEEALQELLDAVLEALPEGFQRRGEVVIRPDGVSVALDRSDPLGVLGRLVQEDLCLLQRPEGSAEHELVAAVLCFPARWMLHEKLGRPLLAIHGPVAAYDAALARRVQRLFDGVQAGRPLWRWNALYDDDPELFQPLSETAPRVHRGADARARKPYLRSERQVLWRLPRTQAMVFSIHTYVVRTENTL